MNGTAEERLALRRFDRAVALYAHPAQLGRAFPGLTEAAARRLLDTRRIQPRLSALLRRRLGLAPCDAAAWQGDVARIAALAPADLDRAIRHAGAAALAPRLRTIVLGAEIRRVTGLIGADAYGFGLGHKGPAPVLAGLESKPVEEAIDRAGLLCLAAWCGEAGPAVGERLRLRLAPERWPESGSPPAEFPRAAALFAAAARAVAPHG
ncbi:SctK family type III secretion system sorting platform protein [Inquilinus sp. NPDC058860]|uniref:SctK family type III secretion system sorting platform protein n=1 Tax=Inquilinus sp. NPDC058860 TaxID=3346652 RepID=UPI0036A93364